MNRKTFAMVFLSLICMAGTAGATLINVFELNGAADVSKIGTLGSYDFVLGRDNPTRLLAGGTFSSITKMQEYQTFTDILQRTFTYDPADESGSTLIAEAIAMYKSGGLWGTVWLNGSIDFSGDDWAFAPIPDLSGYRINGLYADCSAAVDGTTANYDIQILADVTPVPEPSSFILIALGGAGIGFLRRLRRGSK